MITLHHLRIGRSIFTVWLLEEVGVEYQLRVYQRNPETMRAPPELKQVHPLGKSPVIEDEGLLLSESVAITSYVLQKYDTDNEFSPSPDSLQEWAHYMQWLVYPEASVFAPLLLKMLTLRSGEEHSVISPFSDGEIELHFNHIAEQLGQRSFILGERLTGADFGITYVISMAERLGLLGKYPSLAAYLQNMRARDAFQRAVANAVE